MNLETRLGPHMLQTPLVAASGTVGSVADFEQTVDFSLYGAAVAKSISEEPWPGNRPPRIAPTEAGMLNAIGIQNPGVEEWTRSFGHRLGALPTQVWGSVVGRTSEEFGRVAGHMERAGVAAVEVNLSCPNIEGETMFALDRQATGKTVAAVRSQVDIPIGAKLSPNSEDISAIAQAAVDAGADWLVLTNTVWGAAIDIERARPRLSRGVGGYSGVALKPIAIRCVMEVRRALPEVPIVGLGGVRKGDDVIEFLMAGASAVGVGTAHFETPRIAARILREVEVFMTERGFGSIGEMVGLAVDGD